MINDQEPEGGEKLTPQELAQRWKMTTDALAMMRHRKKGPAWQKYGGAVRYLLSDIEEYEAAARQSTKDQP